MSDLDYILFLVEFANKHVITRAFNREQAKRNAQKWLGQDPEKYTVTPLTEPGDQIHLDVTLQV